MNSQEFKRCTKCGEKFPATGEWFYKEKNGLRNICKECKRKNDKNYHLNNRTKSLRNMKIYRNDNKLKIIKYRKTYRLKNKKLLSTNGKQYYTDNKNKIQEYAIKNKKRIQDKMKKWRLLNRNKISNYNKKYRSMGVTWTSNNSQKIIKMDKSCTNINRFLFINCTYCGKLFNPTNGMLSDKIYSCEELNFKKIIDSGIKNLYCSKTCKEACPTYGQIKYPRGHKPASSREVNPLIRQMCFKNDNYECQKCGATQEDEQLHCHHIQGAAKEPLLANDIDNVITLCKTCHKKVHAQIDCGYTDYQRPKCVEA